MLTELASLQGVSLPTMSNSISAMEERGWVRRAAPAEHDRRVAMIDVTATGRAALDRVARSAEAHLAEMLAPIDVTSRRRLHNGLGVLRKILAVEAAAPIHAATNRRRPPRVWCLRNKEGHRDSRCCFRIDRASRERPELSGPHDRHPDLAARHLRRRGGAPALARRVSRRVSRQRGGRDDVHVDRGRAQRGPRSADLTVGERGPAGPMNQQQLDRLETMSKYFVHTTPVFQLVFFIVAGLLIAGIALGVFNALLGGDASFKQVYAVVVHSGLVLAALALFTTPLAYARQTIASATNLAVFFPFLDDNSFVARGFSARSTSIYIWWIVSLSIGLGVLFRRRTGSIATSILIVYAAIALIIAAIKTAAAGA